MSLCIHRLLAFAQSCVFSKQSPEPFHCGLSVLNLQEASHQKATLIPKLRVQFAEFLNEGSLARLWILSSPTCVGLRYGHPETNCSAFLGNKRQLLISKKHLPVSSGPKAPQYRVGQLTASTSMAHCVLCRSTFQGWWRNVRLLSIAYAYRPRLRSRLTLR